MGVDVLEQGGNVRVGDGERFEVERWEEKVEKRSLIRKRRYMGRWVG